MSGKAVWLLALGLTGIGIAAMVRAQDASSAGQGVPTPATAPSNKFLPTKARTSSPVRPGSSRTRRAGSMSLAERLKAIRQSVTGGSRSAGARHTHGRAAAGHNADRAGSFQRSVLHSPSSTSAEARAARKTADKLLPPPKLDPAQFRTKRQRASRGGDSNSDKRLELGNKLPSVLKTPIPDADGNASSTRLALPPARSIDSASDWPRAGSPSSRRRERPPSDLRSAKRLLPELTTGQRAAHRTDLDGIALSSTGPALRIDTQGPRAITIGKPAVYVLKVTNLNDAIAHDVLVAVRLPQWVDVVGSRATAGTVRQQPADQRAPALVWGIDRLAGRAHEQLTINVVARENRPIDLVVDWSFTPASSTARIVVQQPRLAMALSGPADVLYGETKVYTITISNPGTGDAENVVVHLPDLLGGGQRMIGTVKAGQQQQIEVPLKARQAGEIAIRAEALAEGGLRTEAVQRVLVRRAQLLVEASGPKFKYAGNIAKYQLRVANVGDATAEDVMAAVALPQGAKYLDGLQGAERVEQGLRWPIGQMGPGAERYYEISCLLSQDGQNEFHAGARAAGDLAASNTVLTRVEALADLKLQVEDPQGPQPLGQDVAYQVHVVNRGTKAAREVKVVMQFSDGIEPAAVEGALAEIVPGQVLFQPIARIEAGQQVTLTVTARAEAPGNHVFRVVVSCAEPETRRVEEGTTRFFGDDLPASADRRSSGTRAQ